MIKTCIYRSPCSVSGGDCGQASAECKAGPDINDSLILTEEAARARGLAEIDRQYSNRLITSGNLYLVPWISPGNLIQIDDAEEGPSLGYLLAFSMTVSRDGHKLATATSSLKVEKQYDD